MRVIVLCAVLAACSDSKVTSPPSPRPTASAVIAPPTKTVNADQVLATTTGADCSGDTAPVMVAPGWKLVWQRIFENPIARPPVVDGSQLFLLERANPILPDYQFKDTLWTLDPQTQNVQWKFGDTTSLRRLRYVTWGQKYLALEIEYREDLPSRPAGVYTFVIERASGKTVFTNQQMGDLALADDAIFFPPHWSWLSSLDLPSGKQRWFNPQPTETWGALRVIAGRWYAFSNGQVYEYNPLNGTLIITGVLGISPGVNEIIPQHGGVVVRGEEKVAFFNLETFTRTWITPVSYERYDSSNAFIPWDNMMIPTMDLASDSIYLFDAQDTLVKIGLLDGRILWRRPSSGFPPMSRPIVVHGIVYGLFGDGTLRAFSEVDGSEIGVVAKVPLWYWTNTDTKEWHDLVGGLGAAGDVLIVTTGCRSVYAIQRTP